jgi:hypothetical protein
MQVEVKKKSRATTVHNIYLLVFHSKILRMTYLCFAQGEARDGCE